MILLRENPNIIMKNLIKILKPNTNIRGQNLL